MGNKENSEQKATWWQSFRSLPAPVQVVLIALPITLVGAGQGASGRLLLPAWVMWSWTACCLATTAIALHKDEHYFIGNILKCVALFLLIMGSHYLLVDVEQLGSTFTRLGDVMFRTGAWLSALVMPILNLCLAVLWKGDRRSSVGRE